MQASGLHQRLRRDVEYGIVEVQETANAIADFDRLFDYPNGATKPYALAAASSFNRSFFNGPIKAALSAAVWNLPWPNLEDKRLLQSSDRCSAHMVRSEHAGKVLVAGQFNASKSRFANTPLLALEATRGGLFRASEDMTGVSAGAEATSWLWEEEVLKQNSDINE
ncbi:Protein of unknown function [Gryllus bimaculatus]|nr:Protein of unknown function [Gryllus bimaculatus]